MKEKRKKKKERVEKREGKRKKRTRRTGKEGRRGLEMSVAQFNLINSLSILNLNRTLQVLFRFSPFPLYFI